jgi:hypothetical protein
VLQPPQHCIIDHTVIQNGQCKTYHERKHRVLCQCAIGTRETEDKRPVGCDALRSSKFDVSEEPVGRSCIHSPVKWMLWKLFSKPPKILGRLSLKIKAQHLSKRR